MTDPIESSSISSDRAPRFLVVASRPLRPEAVMRIREIWERAAAEPGGVVIFEPGFTLYQLVDGRYQRLDSTMTVKSHDGPETSPVEVDPVAG